MFIVLEQKCYYKQLSRVMALLIAGHPYMQNMGIQNPSLLQKKSKNAKSIFSSYQEKDGFYFD